MTTEWTKGYVEALRDFRLLVQSRGELTPGIEQLFADLGRDARAIDHEAENREQRDTPAPDDADDDELGAPAPEPAVAMTVVVRVGARIAAVVLTVADRAATIVAAAGWAVMSGPFYRRLP